MSAPGVLAVLDRQAEFTRRTGSSEDLLNLHQARAAVADLIRAARECESLLAELEDGGATNPELGMIRAALARVGGAAEFVADELHAALDACGEQP